MVAFEVQWESWVVETETVWPKIGSNFYHLVLHRKKFAYSLFKWYISQTVGRHLACSIRSAAAKSLQPCPTLCDPINGSPPGSSVHGISQARILEWLPFPSPGDLPNPRTEPTSPALQADSLLLSHQGSPRRGFLKRMIMGSNEITCVKLLQIAKHYRIQKILGKNPTKQTNKVVQWLD